MPASGEHHPAFEEYCECIFELNEDDVDVIQARIAERLQVSRPAVSEMMKRLEAEGLITSEGGIRLTEAGLRLGERVVRRHRLPPGVLPPPGARAGFPGRSPCRKSMTRWTIVTSSSSRCRSASMV